MLGQVSAASAAVGGIIGAFRYRRIAADQTVRDITVSRRQRGARGADYRRCAGCSGSYGDQPSPTGLPDAPGGKIESTASTRSPPGRSFDGYTPGVARVCMLFTRTGQGLNLTIKRNCIAVVTAGPRCWGLAISVGGRHAGDGRQVHAL